MNIDLNDLGERNENECEGMARSSGGAERKCHCESQGLSGPKRGAGSGAYVVEEVEAWPEAVEGAGLLDELAAVIGRYVVLPQHGAEALSLWVLHTYAFELREVSAYIGVESPEKRCGKTTLLGVLSQLAHRPVVAANISPSAFFRVIEEVRPALLIDEADTFLQGNDELKGILNSGYDRKTAYVVRVGGRDQAAREEQGNRLARFSCWCPKVIASIGRLPETLSDRCIVIRMQRKTVKEGCERLRNLDGMELRRRCARFVRDKAVGIARGRPEIPAELNDRAADIWEPLLVLADLAGGSWPERARQAAVGLSGRAEEHSTIGSLLFDIFMAFAVTGQKGMRSRELVARLSEGADRPWMEARNGKGVTELWLARQLRAYGVRPRCLRFGEVVGKGYSKEDFTEAFRRYMPKSEMEEYLRGTKPQENEQPGETKPTAN